MKGALFYGVALVAAPILGTLAALAVGSEISDAAGWAALLGLPASVTGFFGWALRRRPLETVLVAPLSSVFAFGVLLLFVWYRLAVNDFS